mmetsp:Transcript_4261/g.10949  ORF Transcript_4261/g.10949 Transcript_4261/m.10949 type:complete len:189 (+) Transcript_4261:744-1310(+)
MRVSQTGAGRCCGGICRKVLSRIPPSCSAAPTSDCPLLLSFLPSSAFNTPISAARLRHGAPPWRAHSDHHHPRSNRTSFFSFCWLSSFRVLGRAGFEMKQILIANKSDSAKRAISTSMGEALAAEFGIHFFETSAKTGSYVEDAFIHISRNVKNRLEAEKPAGSNATGGAPVGVVKATKPKKQKKKCC